MQSILNRNCVAIYFTRALPTSMILILISVLACLLIGIVLSETFAQFWYNSKQVAIVAATTENERHKTTESLKVKVANTDTDLLKIYIGEARKALKNNNTNRALVNLDLAQHVLQLVQSYQEQHSSIQR
jgi:hypothetical protein